MGTIKKVILQTALFFLIAPALAYAQFDIFPKGGIKLEQGQIRLGRVEIHPAFTFATRYEDNVFLNDGATTDQTDDFIFVNRPSLGLELKRAPGEVFGFNLKYSGSDQHYLELSDTEDAFDHTVAGAVNLGGPGGKGDLTIGGDYIVTREVQNRDFQSNIGNRVDNTTLHGFADLIYSLSKVFKAQLKADAAQLEYGGTSSTEDVDNYNIGGSLFWQATALTAFGVKYNHRFERYKNQSTANVDSDSDQVFFAVRWVPTALINGELAVGYDTKRFENASGENRQDYIYQVHLNYSPWERTRFSLDGNRDIVNSTFGFIQAYVYTTIGLTASQKLGKKFTTEAEVRYQNLDYQRSTTDSADGNVKTRVDNTYTASLALLYDIQKWLQAKVAYRYETNKSNFYTRDYEANVGVVSLTAHY